VALENSEFTYPRPNLIVSRSGFTVEVQAPSGIRYTESDNVMHIFAEMLVTAEPKIAIRSKDIKVWQESQGPEQISETDRARIVENIRRAFSFRGWVLAVE